MNHDSRFTIGAGRLSLDRAPRGSRLRYTHVLLPTSLTAEKDRAALVLAAEIAALHRAKLTILHVLPAADPKHSLHWLDAIDGLHLAMEQSSLREPGQLAASAPERARMAIQNWANRDIPPQLLAGLHVEYECRQGEVADRIAEFADETGVDLVVMSSGQPRWWMPGLSACVRRVLRLTPKQVLVARRDQPQSDRAASSVF